MLAECVVGPDGAMNGHGSACGLVTVFVARRRLCDYHNHPPWSSRCPAFTPRTRDLVRQGVARVPCVLRQPALPVPGGGNRGFALGRIPTERP